MTEMSMANWLREQREYQAATYGVDWDDLADDSEHLTAYVTTQLNAAFLELAEAQAETPWKPWATVDKRATWITNRDQFIGELVDVLMFVGNALVAVWCTDEELATKYAAKMAVNQQRQAAGYDGKNKCAHCGRAFDDQGVVVAGYDADGEICSRCMEVDR